MTSVQELQRAIATLAERAAAFDTGVLATTLTVLRDALDTEQAVSGSDVAALERKQVTVLFAQIDELAGLVGAVPPRERVAIAAQIWAQVDEVIGQFGGVVDKHMGDIVMAVFGLPVAREDDVERAVRCALALTQLDLPANLGEAWRPDAQSLPHLPSLSVRVGLNTGPVLVGRLGTDLASTVVGDTVNVASRLRETSASPGVYLSASTWRFVQHRYEAEPLGPVEVRGRVNRVEAFRLQGPRPATHFSVGRSIAGVTVPLVGRSRELQRLRDAAENTIQIERPHLLTLIGDAGIGKSRLVAEFNAVLERREPTPARWLSRSEPRTQRVPYSLIRTLLQREIGAKRPISGQAQERHAAGEAAGLGGEGVQAQAAGLLANLRARRQQSDLLVVTLEDIHWADHGSLDVIEALLALAEGLPLLIIAVARPTLYERRADWGRGDTFSAVMVDELVLRPLAPEETGDLVARILHRVPDPPSELAQLIVRAAGGNPYYVEELIAVLIEDGLIETGVEQWSVRPGEFGRLRVPNTLTGVVQARLDRLPNRERQVLQQASVVGDEFWTAAVRAVNRVGRFPLAESDIYTVLQQLVERDLIQPAPASTLLGGEAFLFKHAVLREVTYETVLLRDRQPYHLAAARWLEAQSGDLLPEYAAPLAEQFEAAGERERAAAMYELAAGQARQQGQMDQAIRYEQRALSMLGVLPQFITKRMRILERLGADLLSQRRSDQAASTFQTLLNAAVTDGDLLRQARANLGLALLARQSGDVGAMLELAKRAERLAILTDAGEETERARRLQSL